MNVKSVKKISAFIVSLFVLLNLVACGEISKIKSTDWDFVKVSADGSSITKGMIESADLSVPSISFSGNKCILNSFGNTIEMTYTKDKDGWYDLYYDGTNIGSMQYKKYSSDDYYSLTLGLSVLGYNQDFYFKEK